MGWCVKGLLLLLQASIALSLSGVPNSVCTYYVQESYSQSYRSSYTTSCLDWDFRCTRYRTRYRVAYRSKEMKKCCDGYTDNGSSHCVPVCYGSTTCPNGGTCSLPDRCTSCNSEFYSPKCDPCPVADINNCAHMTCDEGPANKKCIECDLQYQSVKDKTAYTPNNGKTFCDPRCSWLQNFCFPGACSDGYPSSCSCAQGFTSIGNAKCDLTIKPKIDLCKFTVISSGGERRQSQPTESGSTSCNKEGDEWIKFVPATFKIDLEAHFQHPTYTKLAYVRDFKYGITKSSVKLYKVPSGSNVDIVTYNMPGDGSCNPSGPYGDGTGQPKDQIQCDIDKSLSYTSFVDGDKLCADYKVVSGGYTHYGDPNTNKFEKTQKHNDVPSTNTVCMRMDFTKGSHCSRDSGGNKCNSPTEYMTFGDRIRKTGTLDLDFRGWQDIGTNPSGLKEFIINVYEIAESSTSTVGMVFAAKRVGPITLPISTTSKQITLPAQPQFYAIDLTVVDNALNVRQARSYVLYDSSSQLLIDSTKHFRFTSATQVTGYLWQTNLGSVKLSWTNYFYNDYHRQHGPLRPVEKETSYYVDAYDQISGDLPRGGTDNVEGILDFEYHIEELTPIGTNATTTSEPSSWTKVTTWLQQSVTLGSQVVTPEDGDTHKVWIRATDIMGNKTSDSRIIHFDSSPAELTDMWLVKDGHSQVYVHDSYELHTMALVFKAWDTHSGVRRVYYRLGVSTGGSKEHGEGAIPVVHLGTGEPCPVGGAPCYCPSIGPCEMSTYALDLNPIVAANTHIGMHNRDYFFEIEVENEARLVKKFELKVHADNSPPMNGTVWDGSHGQTDVDYKSDNSVVGSWLGFADYESGIRYYKYAVADRCWTTDELYANGTKTTANTTGTLTTNLTRYFVSVIAINNAITPSVPSCSDGVIVDTTAPVFVSYTVPLGIKTNGQTPIYHHKDTLELSWKFNESESQILDYEIGFASAVDKKAVPDIVGYQSTQMKTHFKKLHTGFGQASQVYVMVKAINKVGLESIEAIGKFIIDQTPPTTSQTFTPSVGHTEVTLSWSANNFEDNEDENALTAFKWALGTSTNLQEVVQFTNITDNGGSYQASFLLQSLVNHDHEADKEYFFSIEVSNTARLSAVFQSTGFRLPTTTPPRAGVVYEIEGNINVEHESDIDSQFSTSKLCTKWSGFEHYRDVLTYNVAIGSIKAHSNVQPFTSVGNATSHCFTGLSLSDKTMYFVTVVAKGSIGNVTVSSDGVKVIDPSSHQSQLHVFDGPGCAVTSSCSNDITYQTSRQHLAGWWRHSGDLDKHFTHYMLSIVEDNCTQLTDNISCSEVGLISSNKNVGKVNSYIVGNLNLENGKQYHLRVAMCFHSICLPEVTSTGVMIYNRNVQASSVQAVVANATKVGDSMTIIIEAEWTPFSVTEGTLQSKAIEHQWAVTSEPDGSAPITPWTNISTTFTTNTIKVTHEMNLKHRPLKAIYFSVKGYNPLRAFSIASMPLTFDISDSGIDEGHYVFDLSTTEGVRDLINSVKLGEKARVLHKMDKDYIKDPATVSAAVTGLQYPWYIWYITDTPGAVHHYIQYSYNLTGHKVNGTNATMPMPFGCAHGMKECIGDQIQTADNFVTFTGLKLQHGQKYFTCVHSDQTEVTREKSKELLPELRMCSNGFIVDTNPPSRGFVAVNTLKQGYTQNNHELVIRWWGFVDIEESVAGVMFHSSGIKQYKYGIGTTPGGVDVRAFVDVGQSLGTTATGLNLESGKTYFVTVRAFDHVGLSVDAVSTGVFVDTSPPKADFVRVGSLLRHRTVVHCNRVEIHWGHFDDLHSALITYRVAIGTHAHSQDIVPFTEVSHNFVILHGLPLIEGHNYYAQILATNVVGLSTVANSPVFTCDKTGPAKGYVYDGPDRKQGDWDYQQDTTEISANWFGFQDGESRVRYYVAVGTAREKQDAHTFEDVGQVKAYTVIMKLIPGEKYYVTVKACNEIDMCTTATSDGVVADDSPPLPGVIKVGYDDFHSTYQAETSSISIRWFGFHDPHSFIRQYEWCIGKDDSDDCSEVSYTYAHLTEQVHKGGLSLTPNKKLYVKIKATNNADHVTIVSSQHFIIDNTAPTVNTTPSFNVDGMSRKANTQYDPSLIRVNWQFSDGESPIARHVVDVKSHDDNVHPVSEYQMDAASYVTVVLSGDRQMADGDRYWAIVTGCNAAGLCTTATSGALLVDSTPPHLGHFKHTLTYGDGGSKANLEWEEFYDGQSGIDKYVVAFGTNYHKWDILQPTDVAHDSSSAVQSHTFSLTSNVNVGDVVYITIYAVNGAGMTSDIGQTSVKVVSPDNLFIQRHSCVVFGCKKVCSCGEYGGTFYNCRHDGNVQACTNTSGPGNLKVVDGLDITNDQDYTASEKCLAGTWSLQDNAFRYDWGFGQKKQGMGTGLLNLLTEKFVFDNGLLKTAVYCLPYNKALLQGEDYSLYVRFWWNKDEYTEVESDGVRVDFTPPKVARGYGVWDTLSESDNVDVEYTQSTSAIYARWDKTFSDADSGIHHYEVIVGTTVGGDEILTLKDVGTATAFSRTGLTISQGTKYYITVRAVNNVGLTANKSSDGVTVDNEPPRGGAVFNGRWRHHHRFMSSSDKFEISWIGFSDKHSFIKEYHWGIGDNNRTVNTKQFVNVGIANRVTHPMVSLTHGASYYIIVKAVDAAGHETVVASPPFTYDATPPVGYRVSSFGADVLSYGDISTISAANFNSAWTTGNKTALDVGTGLKVQDKVTQIINIPSFAIYRLLIETQPPCKQLFSDIHIGNHTYLLHLTDELTKCTFVMDVPLEEAVGIEFSLVEEFEVTVTKISLKQAVSTSPIDPVASVTVRQVGLTDLFVHWSLTDLESRIRYTRIGLGTTPGGLQLASLKNVGKRPYHVFRDMAVAHGFNVYVTLLAVNEADEQTNVVSPPTTIDWLPPVISNISMTYIINNSTSVDINATWNGLADSKLDKCFWALGLLYGATDILGWIRTDTLYTAAASGLTVSHGAKIYPSLRCISQARLESTVVGEPLLIVLQKPDTSAGKLTVGSFSTTYFSALPGHQSNTDLLDLTISGIVDVAGIQSYELKMSDESVVVDYFSLAQHRHFILDKLPLSDNDLFNTTCYQKILPLPTSGDTTDTTTASQTTAQSPTTSNATTQYTTSQNTTSKPSLSTVGPTLITICTKEYFFKSVNVSVKAVNNGGLKSDPVTTEVTFFVGAPELSGKSPWLYRNNVTSHLHLDWYGVFNYTGPGYLRYELSIGRTAGSANVNNRVSTLNTNHVIPSWTYRHRMNYTASISAASPFGTYTTYTTNIINPF